LATPSTSGLVTRPPGEFHQAQAPAHPRVNQIFHWEGKETRSQRPNHLTPPYVTAEPVVTHRPLSSGTEKLKFVIMATDGREWSLRHHQTDRQYGTGSLLKRRLSSSPRTSRTPPTRTSPSNTSPLRSHSTLPRPKDPTRSRPCQAPKGGMRAHGVSRVTRTRRRI
jgi:hypothetical protein